ncbi:hypothetical protein A9Q99_11590 [Gammaproteobacteria bacterium 45_16_T64]|nr:hypothetical protein A9Q99_11590 [Gammaproteobacteria bacterium 45_16_T64]
MSENIQTTTKSALANLLRPLVKLLIKRGFSYSSFAEVARRLFVDVAAEEFKIPGKKQSLSRISVLTGINRKDIAKILDRPNPSESDNQKGTNRPSRIIQGWLRDDDFVNDSGSPKPLHFEGAENSFSELVRRYGGDVTPRAVFDELIRVNVVNLNPQQRIVLCSSAYIPQADLEEKFRIMGRATNDLFNTLDHNLENDPHTTRLQRTVAYSNIPVKALSQVRLRSKEEGEQFLLQINQWLSQQDKDINPESKGSGKARAGIGIYYFEHIVEQEADA